MSCDILGFAWICHNVWGGVCAPVQRAPRLPCAPCAEAMSFFCKKYRDSRLLQCDIVHMHIAHVCYCFTLDSSALQKLWFCGSRETFRYNGPLQGRGEILDCSPMTPAAAAEDNDENTLEEYGMQVGGTQIGRHSHQLKAVGCWNGTTWARHGNTSATMNSINPTHFLVGAGDRIALWLFYCLPIIWLLSKLFRFFCQIIFFLLYLPLKVQDELSQEFGTHAEIACCQICHESSLHGTMAQINWGWMDWCAFAPGGHQLALPTRCLKGTFFNFRTQRITLEWQRRCDPISAGFFRAQGTCKCSAFRGTQATGRDQWRDQHDDDMCSPLEVCEPTTCITRVWRREREVLTENGWKQHCCVVLKTNTWSAGWRPIYTYR